MWDYGVSGGDIIFRTLDSSQFTLCDFFHACTEMPFLLSILFIKIFSRFLPVTPTYTELQSMHGML